MFRKKIVNEMNEYDAHMRTLRDELAEISWNMKKKIEDAYIKSKAVELYVEGSPDWKKAVSDRNTARERLHYSICAYDNKRAEILLYNKVNYYNLERYWSDVLDSHVLIEKYLNSILKR